MGSIAELILAIVALVVIAILLSVSLTWWITSRDVRTRLHLNNPWRMLQFVMGRRFSQGPIENLLIGNREEPLIFTLNQLQDRSLFENGTSAGDLAYVIKNHPSWAVRMAALAALKANANDSVHLVRKLADQEMARRLTDQQKEFLRTMILDEPTESGALEESSTCEQ